MQNQFSRTELLLGREAMDRLARSRVAVFGVGGVGGFAAEALARSGIGALDLIDNDTVSPSNLNRQIIALHSTIGMKKTDAAAARILDINPDIRLKTWPLFYGPDTAGLFDFREYDYVVDAIDTVTGKIALVMAAKEAGVPVICSMGAGNKLDPSAFRVSDLFSTSVDPLARIMRVELKKRGITRLKVVWSPEKPIPAAADVSPGEDPAAGRRSVPGSIAFVPSAAGLILAGEVVRDLAGVKPQMGI